MRLLLSIKDEDIGMKPEKVKMNKRAAARAVILDGKKLGWLHVTKDKYHKLPGGGVEEGETIEAALKREIREETGCTVEIIGEVGKIIEHRSRTDIGILQKDSGTLQTSYCFIAKLTKKGKPSLDEGEKEAGYKLEWTTIDLAIKTIGKEKPDIYDGKFIVIRDLTLLKAAKEILSK